MQFRKKPQPGTKAARVNYGFTKTTTLQFDQAVEKVTDELKKEGFGVLTTIDVKETMKKKLDVDFRKYVILGACNPPFAFKALQAEKEIGLLLPCNVVVYEENGNSTVSIFDPMVMTQILGNDAMKPIAEEVQERLKRVLEAM
ncbi:MAG: DUF302 domain-containing protein [Bacteroidetes bacterium]|nr:DUF302 domain-containing protein [Bacteroidota bacterium]MCW5895762.1 DUF302 domain-containing protein [Bacteroidota bacterium]